MLDLNGLCQRFRIAPQVLGQRQSRFVVDASSVKKVHDETSGLELFPIAGVFANPRAVFIGFGRPNTFLVLPWPKESGQSGAGWCKFAAFMFWRQRSFMADTKGRVQAGILFELRGLSDIEIAQLSVATALFMGRRSASCANLNARVLDEAGFTCGGKSLKRVYRPSKLASLIWRNGLELNGRPVDLRVIQTSDEEVGDHFVSVWYKEFTSLCRSVKKKFQGDRGKSSVPAFDPLTQADFAPASAEPQGEPITIGISRPSRFGAWLSFVLGQHPIFIAKLNKPLDVPELAEPLTPFPGRLDRVTKLKKHVLFSRPVVWFLRRHLMAKIDYVEDVPAGAVADMLRPSDGPEHASAFRYNLVMTGTGIYLTRLTTGVMWWRKLVDWVLTKHVLLSGYDPDVRFPGETWRYSGAAETALSVDDDSGTYKPGPERLEPATRFIAELFAVPVQAVSTR